LRANFSSGDQVFAKGSLYGDWRLRKKLNISVIKHMLLHTICRQHIKQLGFFYKNTLIWGDLILNLATRSSSLVATWATKFF
jgi:hypothetical protein